MPEMEIRTIEKGTEDPSGAHIDSRKIVFKVEGQGKEMDSNVYDRSKLKAGNVVAGPAVINQMDTTILIEPGCVAKVNDYGIIVVDVD
jgi:N-methylhydantoinase A/oxoprolinase/acetone carboxylase beta subunit